MGQVLDSIVKYELFDSQSITSTVNSDSVAVDGVEESYAIQMVWDNGSSVDIVLSLWGSLDNTNWTELNGEDSEQPISDTTGVHIWNVVNNAVTYIRIKVTVNAGSADFSAILSGKRRH